MSAYMVDLEELEDVVGRLKWFEQRMDAAMEAVDRQVAQLHASWSGAAAEQHREAHARWRQGSVEMGEALGVMGRVAGGAHANYTAAVEANVAMFRSLV